MEKMSQGLESTMIAVLDQNVPNLHISRRLQDISRRYCHLVALLSLSYLLLGIWEPGTGLNRSQVFTCLGHQFIHSHTVKIDKLKFCNSEISLGGKGTVKFCYTTFKLRCSLIFSVNSACYELGR